MFIFFIPSPFPNFGNGKGLKKSIPKIQEREGNEKKPFPKFDGMVFFRENHWHRWIFDGFATLWPSPLTTFLLTDHWTRWFFNGFGVFQPSQFNDFQPAEHCFQWFFNGFQILDTNGQQWFLKVYAQKNSFLNLSLMKYETQYKAVTHIYLG